MGGVAGWVRLAGCGWRPPSMGHTDVATEQMSISASLKFAFLAQTHPSADAINIMLHVQHRPGAPPSKPRCGFDEAVLPGYSGAGKLLLVLCRVRGRGRISNCGGSRRWQPAILEPLSSCFWLLSPVHVRTTLPGLPRAASSEHSRAASLARAQTRHISLSAHHLAGAVWDLVRREDRPALRRFLEDALEGGRLFYWGAFVRGAAFVFLQFLHTLGRLGCWSAPGGVCWRVSDCCVHLAWQAAFGCGCIGGRVGSAHWPLLVGFDTNPNCTHRLALTLDPHAHLQTPAGKIEGCPPFVHKGRQLTRADVHDVMHDQVGGRRWGTVNTDYKGGGCVLARRPCHVPPKLACVGAVAASGWGCNRAKFAHQLVAAGAWGRLLVTGTL